MDNDGWTDLFGEEGPHLKRSAPSDDAPHKVPRQDSKRQEDEESVDSFIDDADASSVDEADRQSEPPPSSSESDGEGRDRDLVPRPAPLGAMGPMNGLDEALVRLKTVKVKKTPDQTVLHGLMTQLVDKMYSAHTADAESLAVGAPALAKLALLPEVERTLHKRAFQDPFVGNGGLSALSKWISPTMSKSIPPTVEMLPNLQLRSVILKSILNIQEGGHIDVDHLKMSHIGSRVLFYFRLPQETRTNRQICGILVNRWLQVITSAKTTYSYRDKVVAAPDEAPEEGEEGASVRSADPAPQPEEIPALTTEDVRAHYEASNLKRHAHMPRREAFDYEWQPHKKELKSTKGKIDKLSRVMTNMTYATQRAAAGRNALGNLIVSIEGRGVIPP